MEPSSLSQNGIQVFRTHKYKATTDSAHNLNITPNLLNQDFSATGPNQKWAGDITYIWTREGWLYLAVIIDLYSRRVIGWAPSRDHASHNPAGQRCSNRLKKDLAIRALQMAINLRNPPKGCVHHTDRPSRDISFRNTLTGNGQPILCA